MGTQRPLTDATWPTQVAVWHASKDALQALGYSEAGQRVQVAPILSGTPKSPYVLLGDTSGSRSTAYMDKDTQPTEVAHTPKVWSTNYKEALDVRQAVMERLSNADKQPDVEAFEVYSIALNSFEMVTMAEEEPVMHGAFFEARFTLDVFTN